MNKRSVVTLAHSNTYCSAELLLKHRGGLFFPTPDYHTLFARIFGNNIKLLFFPIWNLNFYNKLVASTTITKAVKQYRSLILPFHPNLSFVDFPLYN